MEASSELFISLALILLAARLGGQVSSMLGLPTVFGVLITGVILGPSMTDLVEPTDSLGSLANIGVVLLLFIAGLETDLVELRTVRVPATFAALGGVALPLAGGVGVAALFDYSLGEGFFLGTVLTATSVTVSAHVLREKGILQGRLGAAILGAAVIDDILGVLVLTVVISVEGDGSLLDLVRLAAFIPAALLGGYFLIELATKRLQLLPTREDQFIVVLSLVLAFAWAAEEVGGLAAISGAYLVGVLLGRSVLREQLTEFGNLIGYAFFAPVFFSFTGMSVDLGALGEAPLFTALLVAVAIVTKAVGCYAGSRAGGFSHAEALSVGLGMIARGEVALVIAVLGREEGLLNDEAFAAAIAMTLLTTLVTPLVLPFALSLVNSSRSPGRETAPQAT